MIFRKAFATITAISVLIFSLCSCASDESQDLEDYLGDYSYTDPITAMVYEQIPGEEEGFYGILYRKVSDLNGVVTQNEQAVVLYFYSSVNSGSLEVTAGVEDLAQCLQGRVLFVSIDAFAEAQISSAYEIEGYPEFVLINNGALVSKFGSMNYASWHISDVGLWLADNGFEPDYSMLDA